MAYNMHLGIGGCRAAWMDAQLKEQDCLLASLPASRTPWDNLHMQANKAAMWRTGWLLRTNSSKQSLVDENQLKLLPELDS